MTSGLKPESRLQIPRLSLIKKGIAQVQQGIRVLRIYGQGAIGGKLCFLQFLL